MYRSNEVTVRVLKSALREIRVTTMCRERLERWKRIGGRQWKEWYAIYFVFLTFGVCRYARKSFVRNDHPPSWIMRILGLRHFWTSMKICMGYSFSVQRNDIFITSRWFSACDCFWHSSSACGAASAPRNTRFQNRSCFLHPGVWEHIKELRTPVSKSSSRTSCSNGSSMRILHFTHLITF